MSAERRGNWMQSFSGVQVWPLDPRIEDLRAEDIAHALACQNRFAGHAREPYSVAEHSVRASYEVDVSACRTDDQRRKLRLAALMHDSPETYLVDLPRPIKRDPSMWGYRAAEERMATVIESWLRLPHGAFEWPAVKRVDHVLLMTEARDLLTIPPAPWGDGQGARVAPLAEVIVPWGWREAERRFLERFTELVGGDVARDPRGLHYHACPSCYRKMPCAMDCTIEADLSENGVDFGSHARCDDCGPEPEEEPATVSGWVVEVNHFNHWRRIDRADNPAPFATEGEGWEFAKSVYPDTEHLSAMCRVVEVGHVG